MPPAYISVRLGHSSITIQTIDKNIHSPDNAELRYAVDIQNSRVHIVSDGSFKNGVTMYTFIAGYNEVRDNMNDEVIG